MLEPGISGHRSYVANFPFSHKWPLKTGATVYTESKQNTDLAKFEDMIF